MTDSGADRSAHSGVRSAPAVNAVAIVDAGAGDHASLRATLEQWGVASFLTSHRLETLEAAALIIPDGPSFADYKRFFELKRVAQVVELRISGGLPVLVCGTAMHLLCDGILIDGEFRASPAPQWQGTVVELPGASTGADLRVPIASTLLDGVEGLRCEAAPRYALRADPTEGMDAGPLTPPRIAWAGPPTPYVAAIDNGALCAIAWAPEAAGDAGLRLLRNWIRRTKISSTLPVEGQQ